MPSFFEMVVFGLVHGAIAGLIWAKASGDCIAAMRESGEQ